MKDVPEISGGGVLGQTVDGPRRVLDTFILKSRVDHVEYSSDEVMSYCPHTGQPDFYTVSISLISPQRGLESKSLKLYLQSFADPEEGMFAEAFADRIAKDVWKAVIGGGDRFPHAVIVTVVQKPRGGVSIRATANVSSSLGDDE